jgi:hypothetical protein
VLRLAVLATVVLVTGCTKAGGAYVCTNDVDSYDAQAKVSLFSGEVQRYEAIDSNGISFNIDDKNSRSFECITKAEGEKRQALAAAEAKARCDAEKTKDAGSLAAMICDETEKSR